MKRLRHPIRQLKEPFGKAGLTVAILALVLAMVGGAWAAGALSGKQKKEVEKIAKKFAGKPGAPGANGTNGAKGENGAAGANGSNGTSVTSTEFEGEEEGHCIVGGSKFISASGKTYACNGKRGTNGTNGTDGKSVVLGAAGSECPTPNGTSVEVEGNAASKKYVCNGEKGEPGETGFTEFLPSGKTEKGMWSIYRGAVTVTGEEEEVPIALSTDSFVIPLETPPAAGIEEFIIENESTNPNCPGTVQNPKAEAGHLCVYTESTTGTGELSQEELKAGIGAFGATTDGFILEAVLKANSGAFGSWAVTAE
jgi:hypothetical protein